MIMEKNQTIHNVLISQEEIDFTNSNLLHTDRRLKIITIEGKKHLLPLRTLQKPTLNPTYSNNNSPQFIEMLPNSVVELQKGNSEKVKIHSQCFVDMEIEFKDDVLHINICGKPKVKRIIYG